jgi:hypothetical protein
MAPRGSRFRRGVDSEPAWLGAEALPGGLARIRDDLQDIADAAVGKSRARRNFPAGLLDIAARWMKKAPRLN